MSKLTVNGVQINVITRLPFHLCECIIIALVESLNDQREIFTWGEERVRTEKGVATTENGIIDASNMCSDIFVFVGICK